MDLRYWPTMFERLRAYRRGAQHRVFHHLVRGGMIALAFAAFTSAAQGPGYGAVPVTPVKTATLSYANGEAVITGSVSALFETTGTFTGPNEAAKVDRARITPGAADFSAGFDEARELVAAMRVVPLLDGPPLLQGSSLQQVAAGQPKAAAEPGPRILVASLEPAAGSPALTAIDAVSAPPAPVPSVLSDELAYARAEMPEATSALIDVRGKKVSDKDVWCLSTAIYFEARGESYRGQIAVAQVVLNRLQHRLYPKTICGVVYQNQKMRNACQFSFACDGIPERVTEPKAWLQAEEIAKGTIRGALYLPEVGTATHYHATYVSPDWAPRMTKLAHIGLHVFYRFKHGWRFG